MARSRLTRRQWLLAAGGLVAALLLGVALGSGGDETPAPPAVLDRIADKNEDAAVNAAARMKVESEAATRAADARIESEAEASEGVPDNGQAGP